MADLTGPGSRGSEMRQIRILQSYPFFGEPLLADAIYTVSQTVNGHALDEDRINRLIEEGWAVEYHVR